jgi:hypothetical protein
MVADELEGAELLYAESPPVRENCWEVEEPRCYVHHRRLPDLGDVGMCGFFYKV